MCNREVLGLFSISHEIILIVSTKQTFFRLLYCKNIDWNEVNKIYRFIVDRTSELEGKLQVIIVDHADLNDAYFREYICENWWSIDKSLIPNDWYEKD